MESVPKILFVVNVDWFYESHRIEIGKEAIKANFEVHISCKDTGRFPVFNLLGFITHNLNFTRSDQKISSNLKTFIQIFKILATEKPDICHCITIKPIVFCGILSILFPRTRFLYAVTGLGSSFLSKNFTSKLRSMLLFRLYRYIFKRKNSFTIFQNNSDFNDIFPKKLKSPIQMRFIRGSGVNLIDYHPCQKSFDKKLRIVMAARIIRDKGVNEYFEAAKTLHKRYGDELEFYFYGSHDSENPTAISKEELLALNTNNQVCIKGYSDDMISVLSKSHIFVLPSYREGFPKIVMEASACGCVSIVTDVPGCRDAIVPDITGILVDVASSDSIVSAVSLAIKDITILENMSKQARIHAEENFSIEYVISEHMEIYKKLLIK
jgi:glycosyltransferase involved in cell wall biosynthesis